jgi:adenylate cyclase
VKHLLSHIVRPLLFRSRPAVTLGTGLVVTVLIIGLVDLGYLERLELAAYDWALRVHARATTEEPRVVVLGLTEEDIQLLGRWPLTDTMLSELLQTILVNKPAAVGVDIYRDLPVPPGHDDLRQILTSHSNIIMVTKFGTGKFVVRPPPFLAGTDQVGFNDLLVDRDGIVRRGLLYLDDGHQMLSSFPLQLALKYLHGKGILPEPDAANPDHLKLGRSTLHPIEPDEGAYVRADARGYQFLLDFDTTPSALAVYSLNALREGSLAPIAIEGKVVLVGVTAESVPDMFHTPYTSGLLADHQSTYGVMIHAETTAQLLRASLDGFSPRQSISDTQERLWFLLWALLGSTIGMLSHSIWRLSVFTSLGLTVLVAVFYAAFHDGWWIPVVSPALAYVTSASMLTAGTVSIEREERAQLMRLFSRHVSTEVADTIWQQRDQFWENGRPRSQQVTITVLFSDLQGYTPTSEKLPPQALMEWMNAYLENMVRQISQHGGIVDDYFGDAIKANFGVPLPRTTEAEVAQDARNAARCSLAMEAEMRRLNRLWEQQGLPPARMRIGIYTGLAVAGSLGSVDRLKYTTMGDTVNIAARLESFEKDGWQPGPRDSPCRILVGDSTGRYLDEQFEMQWMGEMALKGKEKKVPVYRLVGVGSVAPQAAEAAS